ncbi:MAG TPA: hypothetical protein PLN21_01325 [Gemmatales bacterium]|nr:hypothetical protein [Gemmatales bacterium]
MIEFTPVCVCVRSITAIRIDRSPHYGMRIMKRFCLSPYTRQLAIFLLLVPFLWQSKPITGPDGLVEARIEFILDYCGDWRPSKHIVIEVQKPDPLTKLHRTLFEVEEALLVSCASVPRIGWLMKSLDHAPWLASMLPQRLINRGQVYDVAVRITPEQWEQLEAARRAGYKLSCIGGVFTM